MVYMDLIKILSVGKNKARIGIDAPKHITVLREEVKPHTKEPQENQTNETIKYQHK